MMKQNDLRCYTVLNYDHLLILLLYDSEAVHADVHDFLTLSGLIHNHESVSYLWMFSEVLSVSKQPDLNL